MIAAMGTDVLLIAMPWGATYLPSIQLGILKPLVRQAGLTVAVRHYNLRFAERLVQAGFTLPDVNQLSEWGFLGEGVFAVPPFRTPEAEPPRDPSAEASLVALAGRARPHAAPFLQACVEEILQLKPKVVGLTLSLNQTIASLALAKALRAADPSISIVLGGAHCEGAMGAALHRLFPWVDVVVRGEGEKVVPRVMAELAAGSPVGDWPGVCVRRKGVSVVMDMGGDLVPMNDVPLPDYDDYFEALEESSLRPELSPSVRILYESARGCWWGEKNHCTFCGLNAGTMKFRSKSVDRSYQDLSALAERYRRLSVQVVDNIIDRRHMVELLPRLAATGWSWDIFYETKANLRKDELVVFRAAGVRRIQPGIESLSTPILRLMKKGVTALQNIRLLKWCAELGVDVTWNLIYGFPGEEPGEYEKMAADIPSLVHLQPPSMTALGIDRFSPYHQAPADYGIEILGADPRYRQLYPPEIGDAELLDLAYSFEYRSIEARDVRAYTQTTRDAVLQWRSAWNPKLLTLERGPGFLTLTDRRSPEHDSRRTLDETEALIYLACDAGLTPLQLRDALRVKGVELSEQDLRGFLDALVGERLCYREGDTYLALALDLTATAVGAAASDHRAHIAAANDLRI